jgi:hypothetical protein
MRLRRRVPFVDVVERQLDLFGRDQAALLTDCVAALRAYEDAGADEAEERYGDYADLADEVRDELERIRDAYASTLDAETAERYQAAFALEARRRYPRYAVDAD